MTSRMETSVQHGISENEIYIPIQKKMVLEKGIGEVIMTEIVKHSTRVAQIDPATGQSETYGSLLNRSVSIARNLRRRGFKPGDVISICTHNNLDYTPVMLASFFLGTYTAPMHPSSLLCDFVHLLKLVSPKILFCDEDSENIMENAVKESELKTNIVVFGKTERNSNFSEFLIEQSHEEKFEIYYPQSVFDTSCIIFSSGTTGLPKAVCVTHYGLAYIRHIIQPVEGVETQHHIIMTITSPFWISNINSLIIAIHNGYTRVLPKKFDENTCLKQCEDYKASVLFMTPTNANKLLEDPKYYANYDLSALKYLLTSGSAVPVKQFLDYHEIIPQAFVINSYGMTETSGIMLKMIFNDIEELKKTMRCPVGTPIPGFRYKLIDPETEEICGPNHPGELRVKTDLMFKTYLNDLKAYEECFDSEGFFKTGDVFSYDEEYKFYYVTRMKDIFKYKEWHVSPVIIEEVLQKHLNIKQAVVVGIPVTGEGEHPTAAVTVHNKEKFVEKEVIQFANDQLSEQYQIRGGVYIIDAFPTTITGKIKRRKVVENILQQRQKII